MHLLPRFLHTLFFESVQIQHSLNRCLLHNTKYTCSHVWLRVKRKKRRERKKENRRYEWTDEEKIG